MCVTVVLLVSGNTMTAVIRYITQRTKQNITLYLYDLVYVVISTSTMVSPAPLSLPAGSAVYYTVFLYSAL